MFILKRKLEETKFYLMSKQVNLKEIQEITYVFYLISYSFYLYGQVQGTRKCVAVI